MTSAATLSRSPVLQSAQRVDLNKNIGTELRDEVVHAGVVHDRRKAVRVPFGPSRHVATVTGTGRRYALRVDVRETGQ